MEVAEALKLLKQYLGELEYLYILSYTSAAGELWKSKVRDVVEVAFGRNSSEYEKFEFSHIEGTGFDEKGNQEAYLKQLINYEIAIKEILQKYKILGTETEHSLIEVPPESIFRLTPPKAFISHGKESAALRKLKEFIETLGIEPIIVKKQASLDKDLPDKVTLYLSQADFVIILATGDDTVKDKITGKEIIQPRQNVIHEIGLAQKTHPGKIIYLLEEGAEFPSNIRPKVWESFKQRNMMDAFLGIVRELRAYDILKVTKFPIEE